MITPNEIVEELEQIKSVLNQIEIKGTDNANYLLFSYQRCNSLITAINEVIKSRSLIKENQNGAVEAGE